MTWIDWLIVLVLNGSVMLYGLFIARGSKTSEDWFLGRRSLAWWAIGWSMFATNVDNADLVSLTGTTYNEGLHIIMVHTLGSLLGATFAAFFLVPAMARGGQFTNAEYLEARFGPAARVLSALIQIQYRSSMLGLMIWSLYLLLTGMLAVDSGAAWAFWMNLGYILPGCVDEPASCRLEEPNWRTQASEPSRAPPGSRTKGPLQPAIDAVSSRAMKRMDVADMDASDLADSILRARYGATNPPLPARGGPRLLGIAGRRFAR